MVARKTAKLAKQKESAVLVMTDLHFGKKTSTFDPDSFRVKLDKIGQAVCSIRSLMAGGYEFDELVVCLLGDVNDGTDIYATQAHHQAESNVEEQAEQLTDLLVPFFKDLRQSWGKVRIEAVPGNHGRAGRFAHEAANWDTVAYKYLRSKLRDAGADVPVGVNQKANAFLRKVKVRGHNYLLYHGHEIKSFGNIPWYGILLRVARWNLTHLAPIDVVLMGHFHTFGTWQLNRITAKVSGTMVTDDDWALQTLGWESANKWWLFGVSDKRPVTWEYGIDV